MRDSLAGASSGAASQQRVDIREETQPRSGAVTAGVAGVYKMPNRVIDGNSVRFPFSGFSGFQCFSGFSGFQCCCCCCCIRAAILFLAGTFLLSESSQRDLRIHLFGEWPVGVGCDGGPEAGVQIGSRAFASQPCLCLIGHLSVSLSPHCFHYHAV